MSDQPQLSGAAAFRERARRQEEGELLTFESGLTVRVRRPSQYKLIQNGQIPGNLATSAINVQSGKHTAVDLQNVSKLRRLVARIALIDPMVVEGEPTEPNQISIDDLNDDELDEVYYYVTGGMENLKKFRQGRQSVSSGSDSEAVSRGTTERSVRQEDAGES